MPAPAHDDHHPLAVVMGTFIILSLVWLAQLNGFP
jgi:hypothetical protein